jgi:hypothetical protein
MRGKPVCRMHGGKAGAPKGQRNGAYRHGIRSNATRAMFRDIAETIRQMDAALALAREVRRAQRATKLSTRARYRDGSTRGGPSCAP